MVLMNWFATTTINYNFFSLSLFHVSRVERENKVKRKNKIVFEKKELERER